MPFAGACDGKSHSPKIVLFSAIPACRLVMNQHPAASLVRYGAFHAVFRLKIKINQSFFNPVDRTKKANGLSHL